MLITSKKKLLLGLLLLLVATIARFLYGRSRATPTIRKKAKELKNAPKRRFKGTAPQKSAEFTSLVQQSYPEFSEGAALELFPRKYEVHGHVVVVRLNPGTTVEQFRPVAVCFAGCFAPIVVDVVLLDTEGIVGELRRPKLELLFITPEPGPSYPRQVMSRFVKQWQANRATATRSEMTLDDLQQLRPFVECPTYTLHVENGVRYSFDVRKVMFCSGNTTERMHFSTVDASGEVVVDMFSGIGYFTLPLAMHGKPRVIHALEKNADSVAFLRLNAIQNGVDHLVFPQCGDNRITGDELLGTCDRVLMGYIPSCQEFLPRAVTFLRCHPESGRPMGVIHYHFLADKSCRAEDVHAEVTDSIGALLSDHMTVPTMRRVKSYAPKKFHFVADLKFE